MKDTEFMNESMDLKKLYLCFRKNLIRIIIATITGALLCGAIYLIVRTVTTPIYQASSYFELQFADDESGETVQKYNGYTWNDLLHSDLILNHVFAATEATPDSHRFFSDPYKSFYPNISERVFKEQIRDNAIEGVILSDLRYLTIYYTTADPVKTALIQESMEIGLLNYAAERHEFTSIEVINSIGPELVVWNDYFYRALIGGAVLGLLIALFVWWFSYILDDSLYTINDAEKRYPYPAMGILCKGETIETPAPYFAELKENLAYLFKDKPDPIYLSVENTPYPEASKLRDSAGVILEIPFASRNGKKNDRCVSFLRNQDVAILGILITEADEKFLRAYYSRKRISNSRR